MQTAFLGDLLLSVPLLKRCKQLWPDHRLALVCRKGLGSFFLKTNLVDEVFEIQKGQADSYSSIVDKLKDREINFLISPHQSLRTGFFCQQIKAKHKISFKAWWNLFLFSDRVQRSGDLPDAIRQLGLLTSKSVPLHEELLKSIADYRIHEKPYVPSFDGRLPAPPSWASMSLRVDVLAGTADFDNLLLKYNLEGFDDKKAVLIFPSSVWATKRWTENGFVGVGQNLKQQGFQVYIMGGPGEEPLAERIAEQIPGVISLAGKTSIFESAQLIARAALVVGNDSASTHLASVCETPVVAVFGPTVLEFGYRPWSDQSYIVQKVGMSCRPCGKHGHKVCPIKTHACMKDISVENVLKTIPLNQH